MIFIDIETFSELDIRECGTYRYAEHPSTRILVICWVYKERGPIQTWTWMDGTPPPSFDGASLCAHNAEFERALLGAAGLVTDCDWYDTAAQAAVCGLPRGLDKAAAAIGLEVRKDKRGSYLIQKLSRPQRPTKTNPHTEPHLRFPDYKLLLNEFAAYCATDVEVCRALHKALPTVIPTEQAVYWLTMKMNARGVMVDLPAVNAARALVDRVTGHRGGRALELTGGISHTQIAALLVWLAERGVEMDSLDKAAVSAALRRKHLPDDAREVLEIRRDLAKSSVAKLDSILARVCDDGRVRGNLIYHGAGPGRWSGSGLQVQNIRRVPKGHDIDDCIGAILSGDDEWITSVWGMEVPEFVSAALRGMLIAPPGKDLAGADYSAIEARVVLWLARDPGLELFASGADVYVEMAHDISPQATRQLGKQAVLGCGFGMGPPKFQDTCEGYGMEVDLALAKQAVNAYRSRFYKVPMLWAALESAAITAVRNPGTAYRTKADEFVPITFLYDGKRFLTAELPSGRKIYYAFPQIGVGRFGGPALSYMGVDSTTKAWRREDTYGGKLCENVTQAVARDLMAAALLRLDAGGYDAVFSVHDEVVLEIDKDTGMGDIVDRMTELPSWAEGLPVAAEPFRGGRYS